MTFSVEFFGYGAGLIMVGWLVGKAFGILSAALRGGR